MDVTPRLAVTREQAQRVAIGSSWSDHVGNCPDCGGEGSIPVAFATPTKVKPVEGYWPDDDYWLVVLSDINPVEAP